MRKILSLVTISILVIFVLFCPIKAFAADYLYSDSETGVSFSVPDGWIETNLLKERELLKAKFVTSSGDGTSILFGWTDFWAELTSSEKIGLTRADINDELIDEEIVAEMSGVTKNDIQKVSYAGKDYYKFVKDVSTTVEGISVKLPMANLFTMHNGYLVTFQFGAPDALFSKHYPDFEKLLNSVVYPQIASSTSEYIKPSYSPISTIKSESDIPNLGNSFFSNLVISLIITIAIYSLPIVIYRYGIRKRPIGKKKAKKITIVYGVIAFFVMSLLIIQLKGDSAAGGAILLWSYVNYRVLTGGKSSQQPDDAMETEKENLADKGSMFIYEAGENKPRVGENEGVETIQQIDVNIIFCHKCGNRLVPNSMYCNKCGTKIIDNMEND